MKTKVWTTDASGVMDFKNYKEWLNAIESEPKSTRVTGSDVAVVLTPVLNIAKNATSTRWAFKVKSDRRFEARQVVLDGGRSIVLVVELCLSVESIY